MTSKATREKFDLKRLKDEIAEDDLRLNLEGFKDALQIINHKRDIKGNEYNEYGILNNVCWIGERGNLLIKEINYLRAERWRLRYACELALEYMGAMGYADGAKAQVIRKALVGLEE